MVSFPQEKTYSLRATVIDVSNDNSNGKVTFEAPGKANDTAKGFSQASSGLINFNGSIVADRVELRGNTRGSFSYNAAYADIMPATYDKRKPNISTRLLKDV